MTTIEDVTYTQPIPTGDLPKSLANLHEVDERWMARDSEMRTYAPVAVGIVRVEALPGMPKRFGGYYLNCFHQHDGTGTLLYFDYEASKLRWFAYGCAHHYRTLGMRECAERGIFHGGNCYHVSECENCQHLRSVDSSD